MPIIDAVFQKQFKKVKPFEIFADFTQQISVTMFYKRVNQISFTIFDIFETILHLYILFNLHVTLQENLV